MKVQARHMSEEELTAIFKSLPCMRTIHLTVCFWEYVTDIRWVVDGDRIWIYISDMYDTLSRNTMLRLAEWVSKRILQGESAIDPDFAYNLKKETALNKDRYIKRMRLTEGGEKIETAVESLYGRDLIDGDTMCAFDYYWIDPKSKCIGHHSKIFDTIEVSSAFKGDDVPDYVIEYILYCNILAIKGKDYALYSKAYINYKKAESYIVKHIKYKVDNEVSCPLIKEQ